MNKSKQKIVSLYFSENPNEAAEVLALSGISAITEVVKNYEPKKLEKVLNLISPYFLQEALRPIELSKLADVCEIMKPNVTSRIFRYWINSGDQAFVDKIFSEMPQHTGSQVKKLIHYPDTVVGSLMNTAPFTISSHLTVKETLALLNKQKNRYSRYIYVLDDDTRLVGVLPFKDVFYSDKDLVISKLMATNVFSFKPEESIGSALKNSAWMKWDSVPVTDSKELLVGVIRHDALRIHEPSFARKTIENEDLLNAGKAVGEVFQIGVSATASVFGLLERK